MTIHTDAEAARRAVYDAAIESLQKRLQDAEDSVLSLKESLSDTRAERDALIQQIDIFRQRIAELESQLTPPRVPLLGGTSVTGGFSSAALQRATVRWGSSAAVRMFSPSGWPAIPTGDAALLQVSWKPALDRPIDAASALNALAPAPAGTKVCVWHEPDVKVRQGHEKNASRMIARQREFADIVRSNRPDLVLMGVYSAYTFHPSQNFRPEDYMDPETFDVVGLDLDGAEGGPDYLPYVSKALDWMSSAGKTRWTVPEFGTEKRDGFGPKEREAWMLDQAERMRQLPNPPEEIILFESNSYPGYLLDSNEYNAWKSLVDTWGSK